MKTLDRSKKLKNFSLSTSQKQIFCSDSKTLQHSVYFWRAVRNASETEISVKDYLSPSKEKK